jgi:hypothetical protein
MSAEGCARDTSAQIHDVPEHISSTGMSKVCPKLNCNKIALNYELGTASETSNICMFSFHAEYLVHLRRIYRRLCDAVQIVNSVFGLVGMCVIVQIFTELITGVDTVTHLIKGDLSQYFPEPTSMIIHTLSHVLVALGMLVTTIVSCHVTVLESKEIGIEVQKILLNYPLRSDTIQQLKLFLLQISDNGIHFTAFWLFDLDISFLCTIFASSVSYIVILAQLK